MYVPSVMTRPAPPAARRAKYAAVASLGTPSGEWKRVIGAMAIRFGTVIPPRVSGRDSRRAARVVTAIDPFQWSAATVGSDVHVRFKLV
ncbi:hypothetical protein Ahu01nite_066500 [Winogradskya humida]|uniref:Uncharacterized protein n=1 Tax=Winogradskya humida TaxID=113566 RepID=A0ABQ3ZY66_9ACTN|nr:hypothetical protein Ahu01nite_066500 [Actinoplanes humidus]